MVIIRFLLCKTNFTLHNSTVCHLYSSSLSKDLHPTRHYSLIDSGPLSDTITHTHISPEAIVLFATAGLLLQGLRVKCLSCVSLHFWSHKFYLHYYSMFLQSWTHCLSSAFIKTNIRYQRDALKIKQAPAITGSSVVHVINPLMSWPLQGSGKGSNELEWSWEGIRD